MHRPSRCDLCAEEGQSGTSAFFGSRLVHRMERDFIERQVDHQASRLGDEFGFGSRGWSARRRSPSARCAIPVFAASWSIAQITRSPPGSMMGQPVWPKFNFAGGCSYCRTSAAVLCDGASPGLRPYRLQRHVAAEPGPRRFLLSPAGFV